VLPRLIRDVHSSIAAGRNVAELLELAVMLHVTGAGRWLRVMGAGVELRSLNMLVARQAAEHRDEPTMLGLAGWGDGLVMISAGDFELARAELEAVTVPTNTPESMQLVGQLALCQSYVAAVDKRPADVDAALDYANELAERTGEGNAYGLGFGPTNVGLWRLQEAAEVGDYARAAAIAESLDPRVHPSRSRQSHYWMDYGRALARLRDATVMRCWRCGAASCSMRWKCSVILSSATYSASCWSAPGGTRWAGSCEEWPTAPVCRGSPSGERSREGRLASPWVDSLVIPSHTSDHIDNATRRCQGAPIRAGGEGPRASRTSHGDGVRPTVCGAHRSGGSGGVGGDIVGSVRS
jgi:hypothetical protein